GLDAVFAVCCQDALVFPCRSAPSPFALDGMHVKPVVPAQLDPAVAEHAVARRQHFIAGRQRVGDRRFPGAGATGGKTSTWPCSVPNTGRSSSSRGTNRASKPGAR